MGKLIDDQKASIFRSYCIGFGHTAGTPIEKSCFTLPTGRSYDIYGYEEVMAMLKEINVALMLGELSICQKAVLCQLKSANVIKAIKGINEIEEV